MLQAAGAMDAYSRAHEAHGRRAGSGGSIIGSAAATNSTTADGASNPFTASQQPPSYNSLGVEHQSCSPTRCGQPPSSYAFSSLPSPHLQFPATQFHPSSPPRNPLHNAHVHRRSSAGAGDEYVSREVVVPPAGKLTAIRLLQLVFAVICLSLVASASASGADYSFDFSAFYSFQFLLVLAAAAVAYSCVLCAVSCVKWLASNSQWGSAMLHAQVSLDFLLLLLLFGAACAAATQTSQEWVNIPGLTIAGFDFCQAIQPSNFCTLASVAAMFGFVSSFAFAASFWILFRTWAHNY